jgi:hypothetical protein
MAHLIQIPVPNELIPVLDARAVDAGMRPEEYVSALLLRELQRPRTLDEVLGPFRAQIAASALEDQELLDLFQAARDEVRANQIRE